MSRAKHSVSRKSLSEPAIKVLYKLSKAGYRACLVGGGVRDVLLGKRPKDFDVTTNATPEQINALFRNSRIIGRRFRLVHIRYGREIIEVATFRSNAEESDTELNQEGRIVRDNTFGSIEDDAIRRDFTINALYYDIKDFSVLDYAKGIEDLNNKLIRLIGDPETRYKEDPVRMLRAIRFAAKLGFIIEEDAAKQIHQLGHLLKNIPSARLFEEVLKLFHSGHAERSFELLRHYDLLQYILPVTDDYLKNDPDEKMLDFFDRALFNTDQRINNDLKASPAFIFAVFLWPSVLLRAKALETKDFKGLPLLQKAASDIFSEQLKATSIPRRFSQTSKDIWFLQPRFSRTKGKQPERLYAHPVFRAAYDFMCIASQVAINSSTVCKWWTEYQVHNKAPERPQQTFKKRRPQNKPTKRA
ncbi:MAG: polynucleotide adenylyltransferase PcnB [Gammaproteobacteria bacterium]|nr:polynucleotide adenylyltransferase PcnB [Gammaproteobacteria bacterium]